MEALPACKLAAACTAGVLPILASTQLHGGCCCWLLLGQCSVCQTGGWHGTVEYAYYGKLSHVTSVVFNAAALNGVGEVERLLGGSVQQVADCCSTACAVAARDLLAALLYGSYAPARACSLGTRLLCSRSCPLIQSFTGAA